MVFAFFFLSTYFACSEVQFINLPVGIRIPFLNLTFEFVLKLITNIFYKVLVLLMIIEVLIFFLNLFVWNINGVDL